MLLLPKLHFNIGLLLHDTSHVQPFFKGVDFPAINATWCDFLSLRHHVWQWLLSIPAILHKNEMFQRNVPNFLLYHPSSNHFFMTLSKVNFCTSLPLNSCTIDQNSTTHFPWIYRRSMLGFWDTAGHIFVQTDFSILIGALCHWISH